jgi:hypothetical protein
MNSLNIEHIMDKNNNRKNKLRVKKITGDKERKTDKYWKDVNRIFRKKTKKVRYETERISILPDPRDEMLENIYYANFLGYKEINFPPDFNEPEVSITVHRYWDEPKPSEKKEEEAYAQVLEDSSENDSIIQTFSKDYLYIRMPSFNGHSWLQEDYKNLQFKYTQLMDLYQDYMHQMFEFERADNLSDEDSIVSYESR